MFFVESSKYADKDRPVVLQALLLSGKPHTTCGIDGFRKIGPNDTPAGTIAACKIAMEAQGITVPCPPDYSPLESYLHRRVWPGVLRDLSARKPVFIKPRSDYKTFTGFVADPDDEKSVYTTLAILEKFPNDTPIWFSDPVVFVSEFRYYVSNGKILGCGRYDDGPEDTPEPDRTVVLNMVDKAGNKGLAAYGLDVGVLSTGETALVEINDAWATGYYKGTLTPQDYLMWLEARWEQLLALRGQYAVT